MITLESMEPNFTLDGVEYEAHRIYRRIGYRYVGTPLAIVRCRRCGNSDADASVQPVHRRLFHILRCSLPFLIFFVIIIISSSGWLFAPGQTIQETLAGIFAIIAIAVMCGLGA